MPEGKDKEIDDQSEKNAEPAAEEQVEEGNAQNEIVESAEKQSEDASEISATEESDDQKEPVIEESSKALETEENVSDEMQAVEDFDLNLLLDIPLEITVELGRAKVQIQELLKLGPGSTVKLSKLEGEPVDILANDKLIARGEVVLQNKKYGIRITEITSRMNRIKTLS